MLFVACGTRVPVCFITKRKKPKSLQQLGMQNRHEVLFQSALTELNSSQLAQSTG